MRPRNCLEYFVVPEIKEALGKQGGGGQAHVGWVHEQTLWSPQCPIWDNDKWKTGKNK
jgi:hypothetical protein